MAFLCYLCVAFGCGMLFNSEVIHTNSNGMINVLLSL